jgi:hypothetical protein
LTEKISLGVAKEVLKSVPLACFYVTSLADFFGARAFREKLKIFHVFWSMGREDICSNRPFKYKKG